MGMLKPFTHLEHGWHAAYLLGGDFTLRQHAPRSDDGVQAEHTAIIKESRASIQLRYQSTSSGGFDIAAGLKVMPRPLFRRSIHLSTLRRIFPSQLHLSKHHLANPRRIIRDLAATEKELPVLVGWKMLLAKAAGCCRCSRYST